MCSVHCCGSASVPPSLAIDRIFIGRGPGCAAHCQVAEPTVPVKARLLPPQVLARAVRSLDHGHLVAVAAEWLPLLLLRHPRGQVP